jgi:glutamate carboxypeptidase
VTPSGAATGPTVSIPDLLEQANRRSDAFVDELRSMVDVDCGSYTPDGVNRIADAMARRFEDEGWSIERRLHKPADGEAQLGDLLIGRIEGANPAGRTVLLVGHMDTVFPEGTAAERPFAIREGRAMGPGVSDMKGGLLLGRYAVACLRAVGFDDFARITYCCNPDEEIGSPFSGPHILEIAREVDASFVLEGGRENGDVVSARKGVADVHVVYHGRSSHAGVEPERGRSAILQAAHATVALHALNGMRPGVTVNVGVVAGGTRANVVPDLCALAVDVRAPTVESFDAAVAEVRRVAADIVVPDVTVEVQPDPGFPPMERTPGTAELAERAKAIAEQVGVTLNDASTGGGSDASPISGIGVPVLDGLGPVGGDDHSPKEWLDVASIPTRMAILAGLIAGA